MPCFERPTRAAAARRLLFVAGLFALDQLSKDLTERMVGLSGRQLLGPLWLETVPDPKHSLFGHSASWLLAMAGYLFSLLVAAGVLLVATSRWAIAGSALVLAGVLGNGADLAVRPAGVVNFLNLHLGSLWYTCNLSDLAIFSGAAILAGVTIRRVGAFEQRRSWSRVRS